MNTRLINVEALRFLAALFVVLYHVPTIGIGAFGADIFFVISGFVMMLSTHESYRHFLLKRIIRIVPTYWAATLGVFVIAIAYPSVLKSTSSDITHLIKSFFFIPFDKNGVEHQPVLAVGWTLNYEMFFYLLFSLSLSVNHRFRGVIVSVMLLAVLMLSKDFDAFEAEVYGNFIVMEFALGILLYMHLYQIEKIQKVLLVLILIIASIVANDWTNRFYSWGIPSVIFVYLVVKYVSHGKVPKVFITLGGMSYALYLTHAYSIRVFDRALPWFDTGTFFQQLLATFLAITGSIVIGYFFYKWFEIPVGNDLRERFLRL